MNQSDSFITIENKFKQMKIFKILTVAGLVCVTGTGFAQQGIASIAQEKKY